jgi:hypothetical protein
MSKYILIEDYFMRESLCKAVAMDTCNPDGCTSSMADDIFFVLQKCTRFVSWCCQWVELGSDILQESLLQWQC